ncbi:Shedu immune nuclease family protein [uncultured Flavobacterium sp.]|uniref:Shedu immune nuclease family protein n=1 Tax=uncultured Flavobacterium sp. TaxID=165435 RepID=UPI0025F9FBCB|nr:Shedu immune nuclease family protein [uncultured Flavobacterium sp.]
MEHDEKDDEFFASKRTTEKTYFSASFLPPFKPLGLKKKFAHKILDHTGTEYLLKDEKTLGISSSGKRQLEALFFVDDRKIEKLILQQFGVDGNPIKNVKKEASFYAHEVEALYKFLKSIKEVDFPHENKFNVSDEVLSKMLLDKNQAATLISENLDIIQEALNNNVSAKDIVNFGYRKGQLELFDNLLNKEGFFEKHKEELNVRGDEAVWQKFFENNTWILGYGLDYIFNSELDGEKLEQVTSGNDFSSGGKRIDALLKSSGAINSLCFCEIKLHNKPLLKKVNDPYRVESWQISDELAGAIAQVQRTIQKAVKDFATKTEIKDTQDNLTGETLYHYNPKAFILIGNLSEFIINERVNEMKFSSFEMFRKNLRNIEILTYDELYSRAKYICYKKEYKS